MNVFVVLDALGEVYAVRDSSERAQQALRDAESYLDDAATCGHSDGPAWVAKRLPFRVETVGSYDELIGLLDDVMPVLDREP